jgi:hypothetical protein
MPDDANVCPVCGKTAKRPAAQTPPPPPPPAQFTQGAQGWPPTAAAAAPQTGQSAGLDINRIFTFAFQDKTWIMKCLLLGVICLIPIIGGFVLVGYLFNVAQDTADGADLPLPGIDFGGHLRLGFSYFIYSLIVGIIAMVPSIVLMALSRISPLFMVLGQLLYLLVSIGLSFYLVAATALAVTEKQPRTIIDFSRCIAAVRANLLNVFIAFLLGIAVTLIGELGIVACVVGIIVTLPIASIMMGQLLGQLGRLLKNAGA